LESFFEQSKPVNAYDVDINNRLKLNTLFNFLQDVASTHADSMNLGFKDLYVNDLGWVLSWAKAEIVAYPGFGETIKIRTWPKCRYKFFSMRDFLIFNQNDKLLFKVSTAWLLINVKTKHVTDIKNLPQQIYYQPDFQALNEFPQKIFIDDERQFLFNKKIRYTDLDINQHVNNTQYIEMILDCYPPEFHKVNHLNSLTISFNLESFYDDELEIRIVPKGYKETLDLIDGINSKTSKQIFQALVGWGTSE
jgi:medium-chain acyl-[acyl-carrier-protein] hydrolase